MSRFLTHNFIAVATAALVACGLSGVAGAASRGNAGWVATHTQGLRLNSKLLGSAPAGARLQVSAALPVRNRAGIDALIQRRVVLSRAQAQARFAPRAATVTAVKRYLASQGFTHLTVSGDRLLVTGSATVAQAERAFDTTIASYQLGAKTIYANTTAARVPTALAGKVTAVLGLSDVPMHLSSLRATRAAAPKAAPGGVTIPNELSLPQVEQIYDANTVPAADETAIALLTGGPMGDVIAALRDEETINGYPQVPVNVIPTSPYSTDPNNPLTDSLKWYLDTQMSTAMAHNVSELDLYDVGTFTDNEVALAINQFVSQDRAKDLSVSLGECDVLAFLDGAMIASDDSLAIGAVQGQSSFASTGDNGYACPEVASTGVPEGPPGVSWPSDGYYTSAAGGTSIYGSGTTVTDETAWVGGGGGVSPWESAPSWTMQANPFGQSWQYTNQGGRAVPDISAVADGIVSPVMIDTGNGSFAGVGGTSVASPLSMGLWARVDNLSANTLGLASFNFYKEYNATNPGTVSATPIGSTYYLPNTNPQPVPGLQDITQGTNGGCVATPGWDDCTGVGEIRAAALATALGY